MRTHQLRVLLVAVVACGATGCALFSKSAPITPRYFSPESPDDVVQPSARRPEPPAELRLGRIGSAANLGEMLVFRTGSASEVSYYRLRRWTEAPERYLRRRLARVLFEERGLREVIGGDGPTLDVDLTAFEEVRLPREVARVQVIVRLHERGLVGWQETVTVEQPVVAIQGGDPAEAAVAAIGAALRVAVDQIADRLLLELASAPAPRAAR